MSWSPFNEDVKGVKFAKFSHKTKHLKGIQHQLDPNLDTKQLVHHATMQYVDLDADGDVDVFDKKTPDENPQANFDRVSKQLMKKEKGELKHTRRGVAFEGNLHQWFKGSKSKDGKPGWVNVVTGGTCASDEPGEGVPKCVSSSKRASMTKAERLSASRRKKKADKGQQQKSGAAKPTYVSTDKPKKKMNEAKDQKGKSSGSKDACYNKVKSRYDVWPSAYASGALVKCRKVGAANWGNKKEGFEFEFNQDYHKSLVEKCWVGYTQKGMKKKGDKMVPNCVPVNEKVERYNELGQTVAVTLRWRGKIFYLQLFFPTVKFPNRKDIEVQVQKIYPDAIVMMAVPATVDPTKPTIRVAEEVLQEKPGDGYLGPTPIPNPIRMAKDAVDSTNRASAEKVRRVNEILPGSASMPKHKYFNKDTSPAYKRYFGGGVKEEVLPDGPAADKRNPQKPKRKTQGGDVRPGIKEQSVPVTAYNKGDRFTGRAGAMTPKEIERSNEGSANRIRKTIKLANSHEPEGEMVEGAAWTKKSGKNPKGGLNEKGRKSYERENPGSDLKAPSKKVGNKRRASFCARMRGMRKRQKPSNNTGEDRLSKSLRAWNC